MQQVRGERAAQKSGARARAFSKTTGLRAFSKTTGAARAFRNLK